MKILSCYIAITSILLITFVFRSVAQDVVRAQPDSVQPNIRPSRVGMVSGNAVEANVVYSSADSITVNLSERYMDMFKGATIDYDNINITSDYIRINFNENVLHAHGVEDSTGLVSGKPVFKESDDEFTSEEMHYNFKSKKGIIKKIVTQEGEGYLHGKLVKKMEDNTINIRHGSYTTCSAEHPHFELRFNKAKVMPDDKIVCGPAYLVVEDIPTPLFLPFGFFPITKGRASGILVPEPGESDRQGFYLRNGGYYLGINDYMDMELRGDIYTNKSWAARLVNSYNKRYRYNGSVQLKYAVNFWSEKELPDYRESKDFIVNWSHRQSAQARPNSMFSANVNAGTSDYNTFNTMNVNERLSNTMQSSISYTRKMGKLFNISTNLRHSQNTLTRKVSLLLPEMTLSMGRIYPFRAKKDVGSKGFFKNISLSYVMNAKNELNVTDTLLFTPQALKQFRNGVRQSIPIQSSTKLWKYISWSNSVNTTVRSYASSTRKNWEAATATVVSESVPGLETAVDFGFSSSFSTKIYGMFLFKLGPVKAIRHVITPSAGFSYRPDFSRPWWGYYLETQTNSLGKRASYSIHENGIYGKPPTGKSGSLNFSLVNNIEMKVRSMKDTITGMKKVKLIDQLALATSYDLAKDTMKWSVVSLNGRTRLFKKIDVSYSAVLDPYLTDSNSLRVNKYLLFERGQLLRRSSSSWNFSFNYNLKPENKKKSSYYVPWNLTFSYSFRYTRLLLPEYYWDEQLSDILYYSRDAFIQSEPKVVQTLSANGNITLTQKWSVNFRTGFDVEARQLSYTTVNIRRDLHCWDMSMNWVPTGTFKSYYFTIRAKASLLQDLKFEKKKDQRENY